MARRYGSAERFTAALPSCSITMSKKALAFPVDDGLVGPHDPPPIISMQVDGYASEGQAPFHH
jgi:hypothetical protein